MWQTKYESMVENFGLQWVIESKKCNSTGIKYGEGYVMKFAIGF